VCADEKRARKLAEQRRIQLVEEEQAQGLLQWKIQAVKKKNKKGRRGVTFHGAMPCHRHATASMASWQRMSASGHMRC
jgi:hypothetical protein